MRTMPGSVRSRHPQASLAAIGAHASFIVGRQTLGFALGRASPFGRLYDIGGHILLIGVGHNRNTFLHHAESLTPHPRLKVRRFPTRWTASGSGSRRSMSETTTTRTSPLSGGSSRSRRASARCGSARPHPGAAVRVLRRPQAHRVAGR
jgi:hypothetical protein